MSVDRLGWRVERVKEYFEIFCMVEKTCGFAEENEGKLGGFRRWQDGQVDSVMIRKRGDESKLPNGTLPCRVPCVTENQWNQAKALYLSGKTWKAIGSELKLNFATLTSKASKEGITKVRKEMRNTISSKETVSLESLSALVRSKLAQDAASTLERVNGYDLNGIKDESTRETILGSVAKRSALVFGWSEQGEQASVSINLLGSMPDRSIEVSVTNESETK